MAETAPNQRLLEEIKKGNQFAFKRFFDHHKVKVFYFSRKFVNDEDQAKDMVQVVFVKFWENRHKINISKPLDALLYVLTKNTCIDHLRKTARSRNLTSQYIQNLKINPNQTENAVHYRELLHQAEHIVEQLPEKQKKVYQMAKWEKMSYDDIADNLEISKNTVKTQLKLANAFVKKNMLRIYGKAISLLVTLLIIAG